MEINENSIYLNNEVVKSGVLAESKPPVVIGIEPTDTNDIWLPIVKELDVMIPISDGYGRVSGEPTAIKMSFDQHNILPVIIKKEIPVDLNFVDDSGNVINMDSSAEVYLIKLVGNLYYNVLVNNFEPIKTSYLRENTVFNTFGSILMNDEFGYVSDLSHVPSDIRERFKFNFTSSPISENKDIKESKGGSEIVSAMEIQEYIRVTVTIVVMLNQGPIS